MECPFLCGFRTSNENQAEYQITAHVELHHTPDSHFAAEDEDLKFALALQREEEERISADARSHENATRSTIEDFGPRKERAVKNAADDDFPYVDCPECEDFVHLVELDEHMNNYLSLQYSSDTISGTMAELDSGSSTSLHQSTASESSTTIARPVGKHNDRSYGETSAAAFAEHQSRGARLGKKELGPYAFEEKMPESVLKKLREGESTRRINRIGRDGRIFTERVVENEVTELIPTIARLSVTSSLGPSNVYVCHPSVHHVHKGTSPGYFCGYRNIQMLVSYIIGTKAKGHERFEKGLPGILQIQDLIEEAWDREPYSLGRQETGGIRNTRKWIGTPEVASFCKHLNLVHSFHTFSGTDGKRAHEHLLDFVEVYFSQDAQLDSKVHNSHRPPIFLQQPGHSMTIIGFERCNSGKRNLLVFDPAFGPPKQLQDLASKPARSVKAADCADLLLKTYRRSAIQLEKYREFEILTLEELTLPV